VTAGELTLSDLVEIATVMFVTVVLFGAVMLTFLRLLDRRNR
jgi:hypothetical protein